jgi:hypothetical protein
MSKALKILLILAAIAVTLTVPVMARDVKFEVNFDRDSVSLGESVQLGLAFQDTQSMPAPDISNLDGLEVRYLGPSTMMTVINGRVSSSITHMYMVKPLKMGRFQIGPLSFNFKGDTYTSGTAFLNVSDAQTAPARAQQPAQTVNIAEQYNLDDRIFLTLKLAKTAAYVNEIIPVTAKLYVNRLNVRDIQLPTFAREGFSKAEFKDPKQYREVLGGMTYDVLEFNTSVFATRPGDYRLGPAAVKCSVIVQKRTRRPTSVDDFFAGGPDDAFFDDFFNKFERYPTEIKSQDVQLVISPLPVDGRPADFSGAIGDFQFLYSADPKKVKAGDPITVTMEINGTGNFNTVLMPSVGNADGFKTYEPQVKTEERSKVFTQVLIPESDKVTSAPVATFNYFDPNRKVYKTITQGPIPIQVEKGKEEAPAHVVGPAVAVSEKSPIDEKLTRDIIYIKESIGKTRKRGFAIYKSKLFVGSMALPLVFLVSIFAIVRRRERLSSDTVYAGRVMANTIAHKAVKKLKARLKDGPQLFYEAVSHTLQGYLGNRFHIPVSGITYDAIEAKLKPKDTDVQMLRKLKGLFDVCDSARFAGLPVDETRMKDDLKELEEIITYLERAKI